MDVRCVRAPSGMSVLVRIMQRVITSLISLYHFMGGSNLKKKNLLHMKLLALCLIPELNYFGKQRK